MIVPSMTYSEIRKEIENDFKLVYTKSNYVVEELEKKIRKQKLKTLVHVYDYNSKSKNKWLVKIDIGIKDVAKAFMTYLYIDNKIVAIGVINNKVLLYYTTHFFKRYNERLNLGIVKPEEIIRHYITHGLHYGVNYLENVNEDLVKVNITTTKGVVLGTLHKKIGFCKMNTFISSEMLKPDQVERDAQMKALLNKYLFDSGRLD